MTPDGLALPLFFDEGAPRSVGRYFQTRGHSVIYMQDVMERGSPDTLVAEIAQRNDAILVAADKDMRQIAKQNGIGSLRFKRLDLLQFRCSEVEAVQRVADAYSLIVHEWHAVKAVQGTRFWVEVGSSYIRTQR
ncbi:MAG: DUF5615 family PIN-like protein [Parvularcula sp.]|nr:DUF5615 family PIN-like protein [Parvularcula sp.]